QIEPSDFTITSFGELSFLFSKLSQITVIAPSISVRVTRRASCSQETSRPWRSRVWPLALFDGLRNTETAPVSSSQRMMRLFGMSLHSTYRPSPKYTGPPLRRVGVGGGSAPAGASRYFAKLGCSTTTAGSG